MLLNSLKKPIQTFKMGLDGCLISFDIYILSTKVQAIAFMQLFWNEGMIH